ncbi:MAG TPA: EAL domain-containing protein [Chloroflexota bacterium]|nr:EAL domain-containing protein [Chloroflexota bacterium]
MKQSLIANLIRRLTLLRTFAVLSAFILALIAALLAWSVQGVVEGIALKQETALATGQAEALLHAHLLPGRASSSLSLTALRQLAADTEQNMHFGLFVRVKIWSPTGTILYSDVPALRGRRFPIDDDLTDVLAGRVASAADISDLQAPENATERGRFRHLLEVYVPIRAAAGGTGRVVAVYELYHDLTLLDSQEATLRMAIWRNVIIGFLVLYLSLFAVVRNASGRLLRQQERLTHQALHDGLTDLPNRALLHDRIQAALRIPRQDAAGVALLLMDLDRFKEINDTFGHQQGDKLLRQVGARLRDTLRAADTVARLGGDEFAILLPAAGAAGAVTVAAAILRALDQPFVLEGYSMTLGASIGITLAPDHGQDAITLLRRADVAMYTAKRDAGGYALYTTEQDQYSPDRLGLTGELRQAIEQDGLCLHYQPKVDLRTGRLDGVEALVRWPHPDRGLLPPDKFIPLAEHTGLIAPLSRWVLATALRQCRAWRDEGLEIRVAVNLSARLLQDEHLIETVAELLQTHGVSPADLELELTESAVMADPARALGVLRRLHQMGIRLSIDDFGTGYSSLAYLNRLPVDEVKIDKSFVLDLRTDAAATIARSIIDLGHNLGLVVVAEGVEDQATYERLGAMACDLAQGYFLSRPIPAADLTVWARSLLSLSARAC